MVDSLIPQSVRLKQHFTTQPRLIDDYEIAAAIGLACRELGDSLPDSADLKELQAKYKDDPELDPTLRFLIGSRTVRGDRDDWRRILEAGYRYEG